MDSFEPTHPSPLPAWVSECDRCGRAVPEWELENPTPGSDDDIGREVGPEDFGENVCQECLGQDEATELNIRFAASVAVGQLQCMLDGERYDEDLAARGERATARASGELEGGL